jgi:hypothetical protein
VRGEVVITGMTDAPIPWPVGKGGRGRHSLVVYKGLARAVRRESNQAVARSWGVDPQTVSKWRKALGTGRATKGTSRLHREYAFEPGLTAGRLKAWAEARDPERRRKIAEARRGKPRPTHVIEALHASWRGRRHTAESRRKMSAARRRSGQLVPGIVPWTPEEDELLRTLPAAEAARRTGRSLPAVYSRRRRMGMWDGRHRG